MVHTQTVPLVQRSVWATCIIHTGYSIVGERVKGGGERESRRLFTRNEHKGISKNNRPLMFCLFVCVCLYIYVI